MSRVILTAPATEMSTHHDREFLGFGTCAPPTVIPAWLLKTFFYPKVSNKNGIVRYAPYGLRKIESALIEEGFDVQTVHPYYIRRLLQSAKIVGISVMDPLGLGPVSVTFSSLLGGVPSTKIEFLRVIKDIYEKKGEKDLKVIVGGPGSWQLLADPEFRNKRYVDCVVIGEADEAAAEIFKKALEGEELPEVVRCRSPKLEKIPLIRNPSVNGLIEISRGCSRRCRFCSPTMFRRQDIPLSSILNEVKVNVENDAGVILHAEDVLMYGSKDPRFLPDKEKVLGLFREVKRIAGVNIGISHCSLAAVVSKPELVEEISHLLEVGISMPYFGVQTGIETGSPALISEYMKEKPLPYSPVEWQDVVEQAFGIMQDYNWVPAATLIMGLPKETRDDVLKTLELMDRLKDYRSLIVPLFFIPMISSLRRAISFTIERMTDEHWELIRKCMNHGIKHIDPLLRGHWDKNSLKNAPVKMAFWLFTRWVKKRCKKLDYQGVFQEVKNKKH